MLKALTLITLFSLPFLVGCHEFQFVTIRVVDATSGQPVAGASAVQWHYDMIGLSFGARRVTDKTMTTDYRGMALFPAVGKRDGIDIERPDYQRAYIHSLLKNPRYSSRQQSEKLLRDSDGAFRVPLHPSRPLPTTQPMNSQTD